MCFGLFTLGVFGVSAGFVRAEFEVRVLFLFLIWFMIAGCLWVWFTWLVGCFRRLV